MVSCPPLFPQEVVTPKIINVLGADGFLLSPVGESLFKSKFCLPRLLEELSCVTGAAPRDCNGLPVFFLTRHQGIALETWGL